jgi:dethiobiotin synthetase
MHQRGCFFVGTDTDVGKTFQATALARYLVEAGIDVGVYKPVASGAQPGGLSDAQRLHSAAQLNCSIEKVCPQQFLAPLAPPVAARLEGRSVDEALMFAAALAWQKACDFLIIETAGGVLSPISESMTVLDFICNSKLDFPLVLIAANRLGVVNHTLLTLEAISQRGLDLTGILLNQLPCASLESDPSLTSNLALIRQFARNTVVETDAKKIWQRLKK